MMNGPQLRLCSLICSLERVGTRPALAWKEQCLLTGVGGGIAEVAASHFTGPNSQRCVSRLGVAYLHVHVVLFCYSI